MQQCLPFTVLKLDDTHNDGDDIDAVATVLTVYGIETLYVAEMEALAAFRLQQYLPLAVLKQFFICFFNLTSS